MTDRDIALIIDLVEDRLSQADAEAALARVTTEPELGAEYRRQLELKRHLGASPAAAMTATERSTLRESLTAQLNIGTAAAVPEKKKRMAWWQPVVGLATAAAAVTAIVVLPGTLGGSDDADTAAMTEITVATTVAASAVPEAGGEQDSISSDGGSEAGDEGVVAAPEIQARELPNILEFTAGSTSMKEITEELSGLGLLRTTPVDTGEVEVCLEELADELPPETTGAFILGVDSSGTSTVVHVGLEFSDGIQAAVSIDMSDCSVVVFDG